MFQPLLASRGNGNTRTFFIIPLICFDSSLRSLFCLARQPKRLNRSITVRTFYSIFVGLFRESYVSFRLEPASCCFFCVPPTIVTLQNYPKTFLSSPTRVFSYSRVQIETHSPPFLSCSYSMACLPRPRYIGRSRTKVFVLWHYLMQDLTLLCDASFVVDK